MAGTEAWIVVADFSVILEAMKDGRNRIGLNVQNSSTPLELIPFVQDNELSSAMET